jgi:ATP-dependent DNA helicase PIF1
MQQNEALDLLKMGKNVFLTGAAGTGKTHLLNQYINYLKDNHVRVAITASTGIAATHIRGTTIHSWSGIGVRQELSAQDLDKLLTNKRMKSNYKKTKVLIIDEVSMLHDYQLDMIDLIARKMLIEAQPFGGIQIVLCGDFFQLPPVSSNFTKAEKNFAFDASAWKTADFHVCYLHEHYRQRNDPLLEVLNDIRSGTAGEHTKVPLRTRYKKEPQGNTKATKLYSRNINVDAINEQELANLPGPISIFSMLSHGFNALVDGLKNNCLAPAELKLKMGAEVMFIKNDSLLRFVNGTRGVVVGFDQEEGGWPQVRTYNNKLITVLPEDWKYEEHDVVRATITQVPLRLAWAITIHKSQGMTLDAAEIDLGDAFEPGMGYVALSRVRSLTGLKLMNLNEMALTVSSKVLANDSLFKDSSEAAVLYLHSLPDEEKKQIQDKTLMDRFEGKTVEKIGQFAVPSRKKEFIPTHVTTLDLLKEGYCAEAIAEQRGLSIGTIITHIEKGKGLKLIDTAQMEPLKAQIPNEIFNLLLSELEQSEDGKLRPIYDKYEGKYSYDCIHIVRLFV